MKVAWLTDTASGCIIDAHEDIFVVPMGVILNDQHYQDQAELSIEDFINYYSSMVMGRKQHNLISRRYMICMIILKA